jgi:RNA polymerase sigma factor (sigma-70 family)
MDAAEAYRRYSGDLIRFATGIVGPGDAEDALSSAMVKVLRSPAWARVENHRSYLYRAVLNEARSMHRSRSRRRAREEKAAVPDSVPAGDQLRPEVLDAVNALSPRQRAVVVLTYWEDLDEAAVAERLGIGAGSVRRHLGRARDHLREVLDV